MGSVCTDVFGCVSILRRCAVLLALTASVSSAQRIDLMCLVLKGFLLSPYSPPCSHLPCSPHNKPAVLLLCTNWLLQVPVTGLFLPASPGSLILENTHALLFLWLCPQTSYRAVRANRPQQMQMSCSSEKAFPICFDAYFKWLHSSSRWCVFQVRDTW